MTWLQWIGGVITAGIENLHHRLQAYVQAEGFAVVIIFGAVVTQTADNLPLFI